MGYVAIKGSQEAVERAEKLFRLLRSMKTQPVSVEQIKEQFFLLIDRLMSEAGLYAPDVTALALKQCAGDTFEATLLLRAFRNTLERIGYSEPIKTESMRVIRRISAIFKDIPGGQILGPTLDYSIRLLDFDLKETPQELMAELLSFSKPLPESVPDALKPLLEEGLLEPEDKNEELLDITREPISFPAKRGQVLQSLARGETGGMLLLAYSNVRGYGDVHPAVGELRVGYAKVVHEGRVLGEVKLTEAKLVLKIKKREGKAYFSVGYGLCFGHNEVKAISMAILDGALKEGGNMPSQDQEFVLYHIDSVDSMGFVQHFKMPHYVTFMSDLSLLRSMRNV